MRLDIKQKLFEKADSFIAVSDVLAKILGDRVEIIIYGNYTLPIVHANSDKFNGVNIVYAGSIDHTKGGAFNAVKCASLLPNNYTVHICGFGSLDDVSLLKEIVSATNDKLSREAVIFHGSIPDKFFSKFLQSCHIAINPQKGGENMTTLFPSKIIKYLSHNLRVVSTRIESIDKSSIAPLVNFSKDDSPESIVNEIIQLNTKKEYNSKKEIFKLDKKFVKEIKYVLSK